MTPPAYRVAESPEALGLDSSKVALLIARVERDVKEGVLPNAQVALARNGQLAAFKTFGRAKHGPEEVPARDDTLFCLFSCTKAITSVLAWQLIEQGKLDVRTRVAELVPEFAQNGKDAITVEQLLTHTAGFPSAPFNPVDFHDRDKRLARFASWRLNWEPGTRFEYHPSSGMYVVAEILERLTGVAYQQLVRTRIAEPLGLPDLWVGLPSEHNGRVADIEHVGVEASDAEYAALGQKRPPLTEVTETSLSAFNLPEVRASGIPGGGVIARAADFAMFFQSVEKLCKPETIRMCCEVRTGAFTDWLAGGKRANRGLGMQIAGDEDRTYRGFGKTNSPLAYGHSGAGGQIAWFDPVTGISLGYCTSGHDRNTLRRGRRSVAINSLAASCLG
jgi:CubicO group peptidase (beta-lactamase class C family)